MWRKNTWCLAIIAGIFCVMLNSASAEVRINEVTYDLNGTDTGHEWIELYSDEPINISGWKLYEASTNHGLTIVNGSWIIEGYVIIADDTSIFLSDYPNYNGALIDSSFSLDNNGESLAIKNKSLDIINQVNYISSWGGNGNGKSIQFNGTGWCEGLPTPGSVNSCSSPQPQCFQNWSCSAWGSCTNGEQTRSCIDLNNCYNATGKPSEGQSCITNTSIYLELDCASEVKNGEFEITAKLYNLESKDYDIKVYVTFEENDTVISETYNENEWKSSTYYIDNIVSGTGNKTLNVKLRIADKYSGFKGNAKINARLRESISSSTVANFEDDINILEKENSSSQSSNQGTVTLNLVSNSSNNNSNGGIGLTSNVIKLNSPSSTSANTTKDIKSNIVYKSKVEYFKEYGFYALGIVCIVIIFVLLRK